MFSSLTRLLRPSDQPITKKPTSTKNPSVIETSSNFKPQLRTHARLERAIAWFIAEHVGDIRWRDNQCNISVLGISGAWRVHAQINGLMSTGLMRQTSCIHNAPARKVHTEPFPCAHSEEMSHICYTDQFKYERIHKIVICTFLH